MNSSILSMRDELLKHGRLTNFLRLEGQSLEPQKGPVYSDSDLYKWMEAAAFALQSDPDSTLSDDLRKMANAIRQAQEPNGYLNTYFVGDHQNQRMLQRTQETGHELYCIGHLLQAGVAYYRATGDPTLLNTGKRFVDEFLLPKFGPNADQTPIVAGHPEIEMALVELARTTGDPRYTELAGCILQGDPRWHFESRQSIYMFSGTPFTSRTHLEGHAVRAMYACCGATDYYLQTGDRKYWEVLETLWTDLSHRQMYVTGGVGARSEGEAFGNAYELPNARAYGESCAAIGNMMWNARMLAATGEARFTDVIERALYNGINSGMSLDGRMYCYRNPLAFDPSTGDKIRNSWYDTTCCPPNLERTFASLPGYFYSTSSDGLYVHLYDESEMKWRLEDGTAIRLKQETHYPWLGAVDLTVQPERASEFTLHVRVPGWSSENSVTVNGHEYAGAKSGEYLAIKRVWSPNDKVALRFDMRTQVLRANPSVQEDVGKVAFQRGPVVYCMEGLDQPGMERPEDFAAVSVSPAAETTSAFQPGLLGGVTTLKRSAQVGEPSDKVALYRSVSSADSQHGSGLTLIPYYAWANRAPTPMQVWIPEIES